VNWNTPCLSSVSAHRVPGGNALKKDPTILTALHELVQGNTAGDPCSALKWKRKSLRELSAQLQPNYSVSPPTVARLLTAQDYSLKVNRKTLAVSSPHRDDQVQYLEAQKQAFFGRGWPVISVDTKKRELIGLFKNPGTAWCRDPHRVNIYDFLSLAQGIAIPYGIYDLRFNEGFVSVGTSADTSEFALESILWWWQTYGRVRYPQAPELLILADGGGSNGYRPHLWKYALQHRFVDVAGLSVTVCHYPKGASKWNPVEHRLFGPISCNWAGQPLVSYEVMLNYLNATSTAQGLVVHARLTDKQFQKKIKISDKQMEELHLHKHETFPQWNYTIRPSLNRVQIT